MSATAWCVLIIFVASVSVLAILLVGLVRQMKDLMKSVQRVQERIGPLTDRLAREGAAAQRSMDALSAASQAVGNRGGGMSASNGARGSSITGDGSRLGPSAR